VSNVADRVRVEDYVAMRERAERAEARLREYDRWLMGLIPAAGTYRSARKAVEDAVAAAFHRAHGREGE
jgi:hypothetical protein